MIEKPILFSGQMVRAILDGKKTMTRRVVKNLDLIQDVNDGVPGFEDENGDWNLTADRCPYGQPGDRLWVRETFSAGYDAGIPQKPGFGFSLAPFRGADSVKKVVYKASWNGEDQPPWKPSIHMKREYSRILLEVVSVKVERLEEISEEDAKAEGCQPRSDLDYAPLRWGFKELWDSINAKRGYGWGSNPWVWVISFKRIN